MTDKVNPIHPPSRPSEMQEKLRAQAAAAQKANVENVKRQVESEALFSEIADYGGEFNPLAMGKNFKELNQQVRKGIETLQAPTEEQEIGDAETVNKVATQFNQKNPELNSKALVMLRANIHGKDTQEQILTKVRNAYPDVSLADDALDYLLETTPTGSALHARLRQTKETFTQENARDITAGKNIQQAAMNFSKEGLGSPTALRDLYRDIIGHPREASALFEELSNAFPFEKMKVIIDFVLHSLGQDMKSKGPSISRPELQRLFSETRNMQAILGVYVFFFSRMKLISNEFNRVGLSLPSMINFQNLAKVFMVILKERYPSVQRILSVAATLGISEEDIAKIIIFTQMRDALRNVSPRLFKSEQHRQDLLTTILQTLSDLEDAMEEEEEEEEEDKEDRRR